VLLFVASFLSDSKIEEAAVVAGTGSVGLVGDHLQLLSGFVAGPAQLKASRDSMLRISLAALGWLGLILIQPRYGDAVPWLCFLLAVGTVALARFLHLHQELSKYYCVQIQTKWELHTFISHFFLASCLLAFAVCAAGFWHWPLISHSKYSRQVVDIELVSAADVVNRNELLPATSLDLKTLRKVSPSVSFAKAQRQASSPSSSSSSSSSEFLPSSAVSSPSKTSSSVSKASSSPSKPAQIAVAAVNSQSVTPDNFAEPFVTPRGWKTITVSQAVSGSRPAQAATVGVLKERTRVSGDTSPILSEVTAMDMIESIDSDGEPDNTVGHLNFTGGRSVGGKGAPSELAEFLKALNRRIKRYWQPPLGVQRAAQVEFLINHNGSLAGFKILESSGDRVTDRSIAQAIEKTFPFQALPTSYKNPTLMVHYSFRYNKLNGDGLVE
jgi:TonB family protein